ncbi:O-antigen ligase family protein [Marinobacter flavimaris]|uniref:O-antigen ligase family protein n=2 Tax=Marinobacter flavimaris TaxID=262076 RepID=A0A3D8H6K7_9GAMM|nr:hypothetical protein MDHKLMBL_01440 [Marinobacter flavimaris]RDU42375.1 O-antigen ligase family protein [Marinobacter flavimaris]
MKELMKQLEPGVRGGGRPRKLILLFCCLLLVAMSLSLFGGLLPLPSGGYSAQRIALCFLLAVFVTVGAGLLVLIPGFARKHLWPLALVAVVSVSILGHGFVSENPFKWIEPGLYIGFLLTVVILGGVLGQHWAPSAYIVPAVVLLGAGVVAYAALALVYFLFWLSEPASKLSDYLPWGFVNIRYWSQLFTWLIPLLPLALTVAKSANFRLWRVAIILGGGVWVWIALLSSARGSLLSIGFGAAFVWVVFRRDSEPWLRQFFLFLKVGVVLWVCLSILAPLLLGLEAGGRELGTGSSGRLVMWQEALAMSGQNLPFGMGPQSWLLHEPLTDGYTSTKPFGHPHNMYLMWAAEYGWVTVMLLAALLFGLVRRVLQVARLGNHVSSSKERIVLCGFVASVTGALAHASMSSVFIVPSSMLVGVFLLSALWALLQTRLKTSGMRFSGYSGQRKFLATVSSLLVACVMTVWLIGVFNYHQAMLEDKPLYLEQSADSFFPRFWYHGYFPRQYVP